MDPYRAGVGLGLVLLAAFVTMGRGLGASGAFTTIVSAGVHAAAPEHARSSSFYEEYLRTPDGNPLKDWLVFEVAGIMIGGLISGLFSGRVKGRVERGPRSDVSSRLVLALGGGILVGVGSKIARGCTSGQALTGGAMLSPGSWVFMLMVFLSAYAVAILMKKYWT